MRNKHLKFKENHQTRERYQPQATNALKQRQAALKVDLQD